MKTWVLLVAAAVVLSCTCRPQIPQAAREDPGESEPAQERPIDPEPEAQPPEALPAEAPAQPEAVTPGPADPEAPAEAPAAPEESFVVTEEVYNKTFDEVEEFIRNLNEIIRERDYQTWLTYLSDEYIRRTSDPGYLSEQSEKPLLKKKLNQQRLLKREKLRKLNPQEILKRTKNRKLKLKRLKRQSRKRKPLRKKPGLMKVQNHLRTKRERLKKLKTKKMQIR